MDLKEFSVATFNLYNLNEPGKKMYADADGWTEDEYKRKIAWTVQQLTILEADIVGFQELWHRQSLANALEEAGLEQEYDILVPADANGSGIVCAAIVRKGLLVGNPEWISDFPEKFILQSSGDDRQTPAISVNVKGFSRPVLHFTVRFRDAGPDAHFYVCHLKSKAPTQVYRENWFEQDNALYQKHQTGLGSAISTIRRTAEAAALRFLLTEQIKGNDLPVMVIGDLNDAQHSNTINTITEQPRYLFGDSQGGGDVALYTAQTMQQYRDTRDVYYTHVYQGIRESLDHILMSQEFYDHSRKRVWLFDGLVINNDHLNFGDHKSTGTNDHGIVRASFKYKPA